MSFVALRTLALTTATLAAAGDVSFPRFLRGVEPPVSPASPPVVVPLRRRLARVRGADGQPAAFKPFYIGAINVGGLGVTPQKVEIVFDTSSGQIILPDVDCEDEACTDRRRYSHAASGAAVTNADGTVTAGGARSDTATSSIDFVEIGKGEVSGHFVRDTICMSGSSERSACAQVDLISATRMTDEPFLQLPFDGVIGLGLEGLSVSPAFNFLRSLASSTGVVVRPQFAFFVPFAGQAEITLGGHSERRLATPLRWVPVSQPHEGYWQVSILAVRAGNKTLDLCPADGCRGIVDNGVSRMAVSGAVAPQLSYDLGFTTPLGADGCFGAVGNDLHLVLAGSTTLTLSAQDYSGVVGGRCSTHIQPLGAAFGPGLFILGEMLLRKYYTVFDGGAQRIGFGLAAKEDKAVGAPNDDAVGSSVPLRTAPTLAPKTMMKMAVSGLPADEEDSSAEHEEEELEESPIVFLLQVKVQRRKV